MDELALGREHRGRSDNWRAAFHSAVLIPRNASRRRVLMIRAAWDLVKVVSIPVNPVVYALR